MINPGYFAVIPANVRYSACCPNAKLLYGEITSLCNQQGFCWATNKYFSDLYEVAPTTISEWVRQLVKLDFIRIEVVPNAKGSERRIWLTGGGYSVKAEGGSSGNSEGGSSGKAEANNTKGIVHKEPEGSGQAAAVPKGKKGKSFNVVSSQDLESFVLPGVLNTDKVKAALEVWRVHVSAKRKSLTREALRGIIADGLEWGAERLVAAIEFSRRKNWSGVFEEKSRQRENSKQQVEKDRSKTYGTNRDKFDELNEQKLNNHANGNETNSSQYDT